jgi:hypothetical protein
MIQRAVLTWLSPSNEWEAAGWPHADIHKWSWRACVALLRKHFKEVVLYTDEIGERLFANFEFTEVVRLFDATYPRALWGIAKLKTQSVQQKPFVHVDGDFFLFNFTEEAANSDVVVQCKEYKVQNYNKSYVKLRKHDLCAPFLSNVVYNVGIVGGNNLTLLQEYAQIGITNGIKALKFIKDAYEVKDINFYFEQAELVRLSPVERTHFLGTPMRFYECPDFLHVITPNRSGYRLQMTSEYIRQAEQLSGIYMKDVCSATAIALYDKELATEFARSRMYTNRHFA